MLHNFPFEEYINLININTKIYSLEEIFNHWINIGITLKTKLSNYDFLNNFPYEKYITDYEDLKDFTKEEAFQHWIIFGIKEGRNLDNFCYSEYIEFNNDLKHFAPKEAYFHFMNNDINDGAISKVNVINNETKIVIIIHLFFINMLDEFLEYINNVKSVFKNVLVIFTIPDENIEKNEKIEKIEKIIKNKNSEFIVNKVENKGVDIMPFLLSIKYIRENNIDCDFILKLHTKVSVNETESLYNWRKELIEPITSKPNLLSIQHYMKNTKNLGYIASQNCILPKNYDLDFLPNIEGINNILNDFPNLPQNWSSFIGGNIFWINNTILDLYLNDELIEYISSKCVYEKPPCNLISKEIHIEYVVERLLTGVLCNDSVNLLVNDFKATQRGFGATNGQFNNEYCNQCRVFSFYKPSDFV